MSRAEQILKDKEVIGIIIGLSGKLFLSLSLAFFTFFVAKTNFELIVVSSFGFATAAVFYFLIKLVRKRKFVMLVGILSVMVDTFIVATLPFIWYNSVGGDLIPRTYLLKTYTQYIIAGTLAINTITLQPIYPILYSFGVVLGQAGLLYYAQMDPRFKDTDNFLDALLGNAVHVNSYIMNMVVISILGFSLAYVAYRIRKVVIEAAENEVKADQLSRYFSPNVVKEIADKNQDFSELKGKLQKVAILFCDIIGFTKLSEQLGPERTLELLSEYHEIMIQIVFNNRGTLDKYIGDGMLIVFGTPNASEDDSIRALKTGIEMEKKMAIWNEERLGKGLTVVQHRMGLHFGEVLVGNIGARSRLEYTVIGDTVNVASRIEGLGKELGKKFLITDAFREQVSTLNLDSIKLNDLGLQNLKGKSQPIKVFSVDIL